MAEAAGHGEPAWEAQVRHLDSVPNAALPTTSANLLFQVFLSPFLNQISAPRLFLFPIAPPGPLPEVALATSDSQKGPAFCCQARLSLSGCLQAPCLISQVRTANWL